jgi:hypothetical protein
VFSFLLVSPRQWPRAIIIPAIHLYTADLSTSPESTTASFADDTAMGSHPAIASQKLQIEILEIQNWFKNGERHKHIFAKRKQLEIILTKIGSKSKLSTSNKLLIYITILKPIWT